MFAVLQLQGHQYIVKVGDTITIDRLKSDSSTYVCDGVLAIFDPESSSLSLGKPFLPNRVNLEILEDKKGDKIRVVKFHRKNRYERNIGFRANQTVLKVISID